MIRLFTSNLVEALADGLANDLPPMRGSLYEPVQLVVPNALVETFLKQRLARRLGIAANLKTRSLQGFLRDVVRQNAPETRIVDRDAIEGELLALLHDPRRLALIELEPVRAYLSAGGDDPDGLDRRRVQLAQKLAGLFEAYGFSRPEMLAAWREGHLIADLDPPLQRWQRELWLALFGRGGVFAAPAAVTLPGFFSAALAAGPAEALRAPPVHVFGISYVARLYRSIFASLGRVTTVHIYALNPCREFWEDLQPQRRTRPQARRFPRRRAGEQLQLGGAFRSDAPDEDPENPLLARWGRPGRDNVRLLNQLTDCDFDSGFVDPVTAGTPSLLATLQQEVLDRLPAGSGRPGADGSLVVLPASDPRRALETVAAEIWALIRRDEDRARRGEPGRPLRFSDIAVIVPPASAPVLLPLARTVFQEASELPHSLVDLPAPADGRIREAVLLLLALPASPLGRPDLLRLCMHPAVACRFPEVDPEDWLALADDLQIVRGADRRDHAGSYLEQDRVSWDQGLTRLALGAFLSGHPSGEERPFAIGSEIYLPAELGAGGEPAARALGVMARELIAFAQAARDGAAPLAEWLALVRRAITTTIRSTSPEEETALGDCLAVLERLSVNLPPGLRTSFLVAAELARTRLEEQPSGGHHAQEGVTVASFVPMRALPFRVVFVVGLDERVFPSAESADPLDLRAGAPREGDVSPRQRDEYVFLETLLSARERLFLSYVARDVVTGETREPSSVVMALRDMLGTDLADAITHTRPPLLRHTDPAACAVIPAAARERQAAALGASLRQAVGVSQLPSVDDLRGALAPQAWTAIAPALGWLAPTAASETEAGRRGARRALTLADLRRFLECPLQGSVRVLLPLGGDDDAADEAEAALRAHETLEESRIETVPLLRAVLGRALAVDRAADAALAAAYDAMAALKSLDGTLPAGLFGRATRARHLAILRCWRDGLSGAFEGALPERLQPLWLGGAPEHRRDVTIEPSIRLDLALAGGPVPIELGGVTELLAGFSDERVVVTLIGSSTKDYLERDLLRPWLTHLALAAAGDADRSRRALVIRPDDSREAPVLDSRDLPAISQREAHALLSGLATELSREVHPYLLPCEGVFTWKRRQEKGESMTVRQAVLMLRDDGRTRLSSRQGPVPDATAYPVPPDGEGEAIVTRRFGRYFDATWRGK